MISLFFSINKRSSFYVEQRRVQINRKWTVELLICVLFLAFLSKQICAVYDNIFELQPTASKRGRKRKVVITKSDPDPVRQFAIGSNVEEDSDTELYEAEYELNDQKYIKKGQFRQILFSKRGVYGTGLFILMSGCHLLMDVFYERTLWEAHFVCTYVGLTMVDCLK